MTANTTVWHPVLLVSVLFTHRYAAGTQVRMCLVALTRGNCHHITGVASDLQNTHAHTHTHTRLLAPSTCLCLCLNIPTSLKAQSLLSPSLVFIPCAALSFSLSFSLHTEVGHSGSTVYSNAAASGEKSKETHRGENREKEGRTHSAQFNISALTKKRKHTPTPLLQTSHFSWCQSLSLWPHDQHDQDLM